MLTVRYLKRNMIVIIENSPSFVIQPKDAHDLSRSVTPCQLHLALTLAYSMNPSWIHCIFTFLKCLLPHSAISFEVLAQVRRRLAYLRGINKDSLSKATFDLAVCADAVYEYLLHNSLALNSDKVELAMFGTAKRVGKLNQSAPVCCRGCANCAYWPCTKCGCDLGLIPFI